MENEDLGDEDYKHMNNDLGEYGYCDDEDDVLENQKLELLTENPDYFKFEGLTNQMN